MDYGENTGPVGGYTPPLAPVDKPTGSLYGDASLLGGNAKRPPTKGGDSANVPNPELVNGQEADDTLGLYLDFNSVQVPQPIRGDKGNTDPGPRKQSLLLRAARDAKPPTRR